jgi:hypothetical protein
VKVEVATLRRDFNAPFLRLPMDDSATQLKFNVPFEIALEALRAMEKRPRLLSERGECLAGAIKIRSEIVVRKFCFRTLSRNRSRMLSSSDMCVYVKEMMKIALE